MKIDGEKGEGPDLMKKFSVAGYPTVIFLDKDGNEIDRLVGFGGDKDEYVQKVKDYLSGTGTLSALVSQFGSEKSAKLAKEIAQKYSMRKDDENSLMYYQKVLELDPDDKSGFGEQARYSIARASAGNGDVSKLKAFNASLSNESNYLSRSYSAIVNYYKKNDDRDNVLKTYEEAITRMPENPGTMNAYAWHIFTRKITSHYERGIEVAEKALELDPDADAIWDTLGQLHFANGNAEAAIKAMKKASELNPDEKSYKDNIASYMKPQA